MIGRAERWAHEGNFCSFGLVSAPLAAFLATDVGLGAGLAGGIATGLTGAAVGAAGGAGLAGIEGKPLGKGAEFGAITGGVAGGLGSALGTAGEAAGLPAGVADVAGPVVAGVGGGLAGGAATGQPLLTSALEGGATGLVAGVAGAGSPATPAPGASSVPATGVAGAGTSAASAALPGGGVPVSGDFLNPSATLPAGAGGSYFQGSSLTTNTGGLYSSAPLSETVGATVPSGTPGGTAPLGSTLPSSGIGGSGTDPAASGLGAFDVSGNSVPVGSPATTDSAGGTTGTGGTRLDSIISKLTSNPGVLVGAGALGLDALKQGQPLPDATQLNKIGAQTQAEGNQLASYLSTGTLPPGAQESVNLATTAAKAQVRSTAAQLGLSGSTWEADRMSQIDQAASAQGEQIAQQLLTQGANYTGISTGVFENLMKSTLTQDEDFQKALATFSAGLAGARTGTS
jgi:hypothetical protein